LATKWKRHAIIPDPQVKPGVKTNHLAAAGNYIAEKQPDVIVVLGDWWDMPSLNLWDTDAQKARQKRVYVSENPDLGEGDIDSGNRAMDEFMAPIVKVRKYKPRLVFTLGNHEHRIARAIEQHPHLKGAMGYHHFNLKQYGFEVSPFLKPKVVDGVAYCHYFCRNAQGKVTGSKAGQPSAKAQVSRTGMSCTAGHKQGLDTHIQETERGRLRGIISGSFYQHAEDYLTPQGNDHWHGILIKHEVRQGDYDLLEVSLDYLLRRYT